MRLVITGSAGRLARVLIPHLLQNQDVEFILGIDHQSADYADPRYAHRRMDIREMGANDIPAGTDALIHMAFVLMGGGLGKRRHDRNEVRAVNVAGSENVFAACASAGVGQIVFLSSAAVYGAWPDNPPLLDETAPLRPMRGFAYAEDKVTVERMLDAFEHKHPDIIISRLRPHAIVGPHAHPLLNRILRQPFYPLSSALTQCVFEEDVATAIVLALRKRAAGAFNLAAQPAMSLYEMLGYTQKWRIPLPLAPAAVLHRLLWRLTPDVGEPGWVQGIRHPLAVDTQRAHSELGWQPRFDLPACLSAVRASGASDASRQHV